MSTRFRFLVVSIFLSVSVPAFAQDRCDPAKFLLSEHTDLLKDDVVRLAFLHVANNEQWDKAKKSGALNATGYGSSNFEQAKDAGRKEESLRQIQLDSNQSYHLIANKISQIGGNAYVACLRGQKAGISAWIEDEADGYITVGYIFHPREQKDWKTRFVLSNFQQMGPVYGNAIAQDEQTVTFNRLSKKKGMIGIRIGRESKDLVFAAIPRKVQYETTGHISKKVVSATQAYRVRHAPPQTRSTCEAPPTGWTFVPGSAQPMVIVSTTHSNSATITRSDENLVCWSATGYTGDRNIFAHIEAGMSATIRRPILVD